MSNDNIVKENFKDFYEEIKPLMGGGTNTSIIKNKINKSDIYSEEEQMIGQWIDGKPLYRMVSQCINIDATLPVSDTRVRKIYTYTFLKDADYICTNLTGGTETSYNHGYYDFYINDTMIKRITVPTTSGNTLLSSVELSGIKSGDVLTIYTGWDSTHSGNSWRLYGQIELVPYNTDTYFKTETLNKDYNIIQYTKTTDEPITIGSDTDYSLEEKIIGTWIDDKPLYQKTLVINKADFTKNSDYSYEYSLSSLGISELVDAKVKSNVSTEGQSILPSITMTQNGINNGWLYNAQVTHNKIKFTLQQDVAQYGFTKITATIQYTKTTDV